MQIARHQRYPIDIWPGFVDALAATLIVITFLLMVFAISQFFLSTALSGKEETLETLNRQVAHLADMLSLEQTKERDIELQLGDVTAQLADTQTRLTGADALIAQQEQSLHEAIETITAKKAALEEKDRRVEEQSRIIENKDQKLLETARTIEDKDRTLAETTRAIEEKTRALATLQNDIIIFREARAQLELEVAQLALQVRGHDREIKAEKKVSAGAIAQVEVLNRQVKALRDQLTAVSQVLGFKLDGHDEDVSHLAERLNVALARKAKELALYRSDFFGRLRKVLGDNPDIHIVGDRFVIQSGLLFASGSATLGPDGRRQVTKLANILNSVAREIPANIDWVVRIDGHTDRRPIKTPEFASNWELSAARAISIAKFLIANDVPPEHIAATGFGEFHPLDPAETEQAYARNRRIEIKLTAR